MEFSHLGNKSFVSSTLPQSYGERFVLSLTMFCDADHTAAFPFHRIITSCVVENTWSGGYS